MKKKILIFPAVIVFVVLASFTGLREKRQIVPVTEKAAPALLKTKESVQTSAATGDVNPKTLANHFTGGLGSSTQIACESAYTFFYDGSFIPNFTVLYWDPSLTMKVTWGTVVVDHSTNKVYSFNAGTSTVGIQTGTCQ